MLALLIEPMVLLMLDWSDWIVQWTWFWLWYAEWVLEWLWSRNSILFKDTKWM